MILFCPYCEEEWSEAEAQIEGVEAGDQCYNCCNGTIELLPDLTENTND